LLSSEQWGDVLKNMKEIIPDYNNPDHPHYYFHMTKYYDGEVGKKDKIAQTDLIKLWELK